MYYYWELRKLLFENGYRISKVGYLMPSLDAMEQKLTKIPLFRWLRKIADWLERSPFRYFGSTILIYAKKLEE